MIEYIIAMFVFLYVYRGVRFFIIRRKDFSNEKILPGAEPFYHKRGKTGILFIHGFTSSCYDYIDLGNYLAKKGVSCKAVLLDGHGTSPEHLLTTTEKDWKKSVINAMNDLKKDVNKVVICGDSMGGSLALWYAANHKVDGVISIGTPIFVKKEKLYKAVFPILKLFKIYQKKWYHTLNLDPETVAKRVTYKHIPLKSVVDAGKIVKEAKRSLRKIKAPILIMQSTADWGVGEGSVDYIYRKAGSLVKKIVWVKDVYHVIMVDKRGKASFKHIYDFIRDL